MIFIALTQGWTDPCPWSISWRGAEKTIIEEYTCKYFRIERDRAFGSCPAWPAGQSAPVLAVLLPLS